MVKSENTVGMGPVAAPTEPVIILVEPQLGENIGSTARAMANFGLSRLRLVSPRDGWPSERAVATASGANHVLDGVEVFESVEAAVSDLRYVLATTARSRDMAKLVRGPAEAAQIMRQSLSDGLASGVLFGRERWGLENSEIALADEIVTLPVDPKHASLNIAQAVLIVAYEWRLAATKAALPFSGANDLAPAPKEDLARLFEHLEGALDDTGFFRPAEKKPHMVQSLRTMLQRARLSEQEVRTLRGVVAAFERRTTQPTEATAPVRRKRGSE